MGKVRQPNRVINVKLRDGQRLSGLHVLLYQTDIKNLKKKKTARLGW